MIRLFLYSILFFLLTYLPTQAITLSDQSKISLLTCSPGGELHSIFGHSAIRVEDPSQNIDGVFNYGTFDFNTPNFYLKFARGQLNYCLTITSYDRFKRNYIYERRSIYSQELLLDSLQKQTLFNALMENYKEENRYYKYDFFMDNCATRIDELLHKTVKGIREDTNLPQKSPYTYRTEIYPYIKDSKWINWGLNIILGGPTDGKVQGLFLPDILKDAYTHTTLNGKPITGEVTTLYDAGHQFKATPYFLRPLLLSLLACVITLILTLIYFEKHPLFDFIVFFTAGSVGLVVFFLWFMADHVATNNNFNILWAFPLHFIVCFFLFKKKSSRFLYYYFSLTTLCALFLLILCIFPKLFVIIGHIPYDYPFSLLIPILIIILCRSLSIAFRYKPRRITSHR